MTQGGLASASQTQPLAIIQRIDPIFVDIQQSSAELTELRRALAQGGVLPGSTQVRLVLEDGSDYGFTGTVQFSELQVNESTGTVTLRASTFNELLYDILRSLIHHGWNKLILVNGHGSNTKVIDPLLRRIKYDTGALVALYKPYAERYIGILDGLLENPADETPGWHASELETSQVLAHNADLVRMDRAADDRAHHLGPLGQREQRRLAGVDRDGDDEPVDDAQRARHDVLVAEGHRVEAAGVEPDAHQRPAR